MRLFLCSAVVGIFAVCLMAIAQPLNATEKQSTPEKPELELATMTNPDAIIANSIGEAPFINATILNSTEDKVFLIERQTREAALKNYSSGRAAVLFINGTPSENESRELADSTVLPIAAEAVIFAVNIANPLSDLSVENLRKIFSGEIVTWKPLGGNEYMIHLFTINKNAYGYDTLLSRVMKNSKLSIKSFQVSTATEALILTASNRNAIGACGYTIKLPDEVKLLSVDGIMPEEANFFNGKYPAAGVIYICYKKNDNNTAVKKLVEKFLSPEVGILIQKSGLVPVPPPAAK